MCPFYKKWRCMLMRCYSKKRQELHPAYIGCSVCDEWLTFSKFKLWMEQQDWQGKELDKDLLIHGNKIYSPETCIFVDKVVNLFIKDNESNRGEFPIGTCFNKKRRKFYAQCSDPFTKKRGGLGFFDSPESAHQAWKRRKHELACQLANLQTNDMVANLLRNKYA